MGQPFTSRPAVLRGEEDAGHRRSFPTRRDLLMASFAALAAPALPTPMDATQKRTNAYANDDTGFAEKHVERNGRRIYVRDYPDGGTAFVMIHGFRTIAVSIGTSLRYYLPPGAGLSPSTSSDSVRLKARPGLTGDDEGSCGARGQIRRRVLTIWAPSSTPQLLRS